MKYRNIKLIIMLFVVSVITVAASSVSVLETQLLKGITGIWSHFNIVYHVGDDGRLTVICETDTGISQKRYGYELVPIGESGLLRCSADDGSSPMLILASDITDSTVVFSLGTVYVRADSGDGLCGEWRRAKDLSTSRLVFAEKTIDYVEEVLDVENGRMVTVESLHGQYSFVRSQRGRLHVHFDSGESVDIIPYVVGNIMYLFDLSPRKSLFVKKVPDVPPESILSDGFPSGRLAPAY